jgi:hypothetical protein
MLLKQVKDEGFACLFPLRAIGLQQGQAAMRTFLARRRASPRDACR